MQSRGENTNTFGLKGTNSREWERCSRASRLKYDMNIYTFGVSVHSLNSASRLCAKYEIREAREEAAGDEIEDLDAK